MSTAPLITIGILNWNGSHLLRKFLPDVVRCTPSDKACIVVIDNGSTDDSIEVVEREFPSVKLLKFSENYGFAKATVRLWHNARLPIIVCLIVM